MVSNQLHLHLVQLLEGSLFSNAGCIAYTSLCPLFSRIAEFQQLAPPCWLALSRASETPLTHAIDFQWDYSLAI